MTSGEGQDTSYLLFLPGASLPKLDVVSILAEVAIFCLAGKKEEPVSLV